MENNQTTSDDATVDKTTTTPPTDTTTDDDTTETTGDTPSDVMEVDVPVADDGKDYFTNITITDPVVVKVSFEAVNSSIKIEKGNTLSVINNPGASILLNNTSISNDDTTSSLLSVTNSSQVTFTAKSQILEGDIVLDGLSTLNLILNEYSYYMGIINGGNTAQSVSVSLDETSQLVLAGDSYINELINADTTNMNVYSNGYKLYVAGQEVAVNGTEAPKIQTEAPVEESEDDYIEESATNTIGTESEPNLVPFIVGGAAILLIIIAIVAFILHNKKKKGSAGPVDGIDATPGSSNNGRPDFSQFDDGPVQQPSSYAAPEPTPPAETPSEPAQPEDPSQPTQPPVDSHQPFVGQM